MFPLISITIPAYKAKFLKDAIKSVFAQTYKNWELIILDDASPEDIISIVNSFDNRKLKYYRNENNVGAINVVDNWNKCLNLCHGEYVICMGDDDMLMPCALEEYIKLIEEFPDVNVYHSMTCVINEFGNIIGYQQTRPKFQTADELILHRWKGDIQFIGDFCYKTEHLRKQGGYYKLPLAWASDDITAVRAAEEKGIANTNVPCFLYRENNMSISSNNNNGLKLSAKVYEKQWFIKYFKRHTNFSKEIYPLAFDNWFHGQIEHHMQLYFYESLFNIFSALRKSKLLGYPKMRILSNWWSVLKHRLIS